MGPLREAQCDIKDRRKKEGRSLPPFPSTRGHRDSRFMQRWHQHQRVTHSSCTPVSQGFCPAAAAVSDRPESALWESALLVLICRHSNNFLTFCLLPLALHTVSQACLVLVSACMKYLQGFSLLTKAKGGSGHLDN